MGWCDTRAAEVSATGRRQTLQDGEAVARVSEFQRRIEIRDRDDASENIDPVFSQQSVGHTIYWPTVNCAQDLAGAARAFHWPLEFSDIMATGGFDVVLGNPPWERIKIQEQEFFAAREPEIAEAPNAAHAGG